MSLESLNETTYRPWSPSKSKDVSAFILDVTGDEIVGTVGSFIKATVCIHGAAGHIRFHEHVHDCAVDGIRMRNSSMQASM